MCFPSDAGWRWQVAASPLSHIVWNHTPHTSFTWVSLWVTVFLHFGHSWHKFTGDIKIKCAERAVNLQFASACKKLWRNLSPPRPDWWRLDSLMLTEEIRSTVLSFRHTEACPFMFVFRTRLKVDFCNRINKSGHETIPETWYSWQILKVNSRAVKKSIIIIIIIIICNNLIIQRWDGDF